MNISEATASDDLQQCNHVSLAIKSSFLQFTGTKELYMSSTLDIQVLFFIADLVFLSFLRCTLSLLIAIKASFFTFLVIAVDLNSFVYSS